jgi:cellulose synthase/poly-beta-1,6-N-acetylglucosamine synthase-like glycosyltransferase
MSLTSFFTLTSLLFLVWTLINARFLPRLRNGSLNRTPLVSILVPMRNEEQNVRDLLLSIQSLSYPNFECIIINDKSTDQTWELLQQYTQGDSRFRILQGRTLPERWVGKVHACHQLSEVAQGDYFLFLDADARLAPDTLEASLSLMDQHKAKLLTGFPAFPVETLLSKLLVPLQHFIIYFHLPIVFANYTLRADTTAAHGAFMLFERDAYLHIGGHRSVQSSLVEDVHIARKMKEAGFRVILANITSYVSCFMYDSNQATWAGFTKNIFVGLGRSVPLVLFLSLFYTIFYIFPFSLLVKGIYMPSLFLLLQRLYIDKNTQQKAYVSLLQPFALLTLIILMFYSMSLSLRKKRYEWKGRTYL